MYIFKIVPYSLLVGFSSRLTPISTYSSLSIVTSKNCISVRVFRLSTSIRLPSPVSYLILAYAVYMLHTCTYSPGLSYAILTCSRVSVV